MSNVIKNPFKILSVICFIFSLTQIGFNEKYGFELLFFGWSLDLLFMSFANFCWIANLLLIFSFFQIKNSKNTIFFCLIAFLIAVSFWFNHSINETSFCETCNKPVSIEIRTLGLGYYLWVLSIFFQLLHLFVQRKFYSKRNLDN